MGLGPQLRHGWQGIVFAVSVAAATGCASGGGPKAPETIDVGAVAADSPAPAAVGAADSTARDSLAEAQAVSPDSAAPGGAGGALAPGVEEAAVEEEPPAPWLPLGVRWHPSAPVEGAALGIRLFQPAAGRNAVAIEGTLDGRPVHFARLGDAWFGIAGIPIGESGPAELTLDISLEGDSTVVQRIDLEIASREFPYTRLSVAPRFSSYSPGELERIKAESARVDAALTTVTPEWLIDGPFRWPRPERITSPFGQRRLFNGELKSRHRGIDLKGAMGAPVHAAGRGRVALTDELYFSGGAVYLDHGLGVFTGYFHLSETLVEEGEMVEAGQVIGRVGATGRVTGPHLHWSLYVNDEALEASSLLEMDIPVISQPAGVLGAEPAGGGSAGGAQDAADTAGASGL